MSYHLTADAGGTKTAWILSSDDVDVISWQTLGINPYQLSDEAISQRLKQALQYCLNYHISDIHFYGAGCVAKGRERIENQLRCLLPKAHIYVDSDLKGAAIALFGEGEGIACILGTGANTGLYRKGNIVSHVSPLGCILGDEASGAVLGRELLTHVYKNILSSDLINSFYQTFPLITEEEVLEHTYRKSGVQQYFSSFAPFVIQHKEHPEIKQMIERQLSLFFTRNIMQYPPLQLGFVGGIAYRLQDEIRREAHRCGRDVVGFLTSPIEGMKKV